MRLSIRTALVGKPTINDRVSITMDDGKNVTLDYDPDPVYGYPWRVMQDGLKLNEIEEMHLEIQERELRNCGLACYIDDGEQSLVAVGLPLCLTMVPQGNLADWPWRKTNALVKSIELL